jgi:hypothetical protein
MTYEANNSGGAAIIGVQVLDNRLAHNDPYALSSQAGSQWALGSQVAYEQNILVGVTATDGTKITEAIADPSTLTVSSAGLSFSAVLTFSDGSSQTSTVTDALTGWVNGNDGITWTNPGGQTTYTPASGAVIVDEGLGQRPETAQWRIMSMRSWIWSAVAWGSWGPPQVRRSSA